MEGGHGFGGVSMWKRGEIHMVYRGGGRVLKEIV